MGYIDVIRELKTGEPDPAKAAKVMRLLGWGCFAGALWNFMLPQLAPFNTAFRLPPSYLYVALGGFTVVGALCLRAARGIQELEPWGKRTGQVAIVLLSVGGVGWMAAILSQFARFPVASRGFFAVMPILVLLVVVGQLVVPVYYGVRYLGRLPTQEDGPSATLRRLTAASRPVVDRVPPGQPGAATYKDSPSPFGIAGTFAMQLGGFLIPVFIAQSYWGPEVFALLFPVGFLALFVGPVIFNYRTSPFQRHRHLVAAFTGGGSIFLFHASWPFFRLLVYEDALEVRVEFHRFLIPFEKMADTPAKVDFFTAGLLIQSELPGVPGRIRFSSFGLRKIARVVYETRRAFLAASQPADSRSDW